MGPCQVFLIWTHPLFHEFLQLLLKGDRIEIVGETSDHAEAQRLIAEQKPDVVIVESQGSEVVDSTETFSILMVSPRVLRLSLEDNQLKVYQRQERTITNPRELLTMILGEEGRLDIEAGK
jgi:DNA-binding NarL/FixJ family response regulator